VEALYLARKLGYKIAEIGVKWSHVDGSKIQPMRAALKIIADIIRVRLHKYDL
jgi:dolichyl-phosphate beta-glucosyltransferase